jgi:hypothetical protein
VWLQGGCAVSTPTGYVPARDVLPGKGETHDPEQASYGYRSVELTSDVHRVTYRGDTLTSPELAEDFALLRSAEIALESGFPYLRVLERIDATSSITDTTTMPAMPVCDGYGECYTPPPTTITTTFTYPAFSFTVKLLRAASEDESFVFDARFLLYSLRRQHGISLDVPANAWYADYSCFDGEGGE